MPHRNVASLLLFAFIVVVGPTIQGCSGGDDNQDEWERLHYAAADHLKPVLLVAYHLGPRLSEILRLTWDRVDLSRGFIKLRGVDTKTGEPRLVPMTPGSRGIPRLVESKKPNLPLCISVRRESHAAGEAVIPYRYPQDWNRGFPFP
jgi:integrase